jgi:hypothetical protein
MACARICAVYLYYHTNGVFYYGTLDCCTSTSSTQVISSTVAFATLGCDCFSNPMPTRCIARAKPCGARPTTHFAKASCTQHPVGDLATVGAPILERIKGRYQAFEIIPGDSEVIGVPRNFRLVNPIDGREFILRLVLILATADPAHVALIATGFQAVDDPKALVNELVLIKVLGDRCIEVERKVDGLIFTVYLAEIWAVPALAAPQGPVK